ncbi:hypothetical protein P9139_17050 [Curtobacterium flaccumfaciens]|nr:hypothetical protein P9139_17050 [Curtobacterium flaccumfaciens]
MVLTRAWRNGSAAERDFPVDRVSDIVADEDAFVWVDYTDPQPSDLEHVEEEARHPRARRRGRRRTGAAAEARPVPRQPLPGRLRRRRAR